MKQSMNTKGGKKRGEAKKRQDEYKTARKQT